MSEEPTTDRTTGRAGAGRGQEPTAPHDRTPRFPGFDVMSQARHWDATTRSVVQARTVETPPVRFFSQTEEAAVYALVRQLLDLREQPGQPLPDVMRMIDGRLAELQTDGWHYDSMPPDDEAWRATLAALDADAVLDGHPDFASAGDDEQRRLLTRIQSLTHDWHGFEVSRVWSLWTRYAATAFYSHPTAWNEIGFSGPAYPRGYKNLGVDAREPYEMPDARPHDDPERSTR